MSDNKKNFQYQQVGALAVKKGKEALLDMVSAGLKIIFGGKAYLTDTFLNIFFKGFFVDCSSQEFEAVAICSAFHMGEVKQATQVNATHFLLSFMGTVRKFELNFYFYVRILLGQWK